MPALRQSGIAGLWGRKIAWSALRPAVPAGLDGKNTMEAGRYNYIAASRGPADLLAMPFDFTGKPRTIKDLRETLH